jgi:transposase
MRTNTEYLAEMKKMGRPKTTGRFATRQELLDRIWMLYENGGMSLNGIARSCKVSNTTVSHVIDAGERTATPDTRKKRVKPDRDRPLTEAEMEAIDKMTENARDVLGHCGHGWMPDECRVHLPRREYDDVWNKHEADAAQYFRPPPSMKERTVSMVRVWMDWNLSP